MMIDMKNKKIFSGYGSIAVGSTSDNRLIIRVINPNQEIGKTVSKDTEYAEVVIMQLDFDFCTYLLSKLNQVTEKNHSFMVGDTEISFEKFNLDSIEVWIKAVTIIKNNIISVKEGVT